MTTQAYIKSIEAENELLRNKIDAYEAAIQVFHKHTYITKGVEDWWKLTSHKDCQGKLNIVLDGLLIKEEIDILSKFISVATKNTNFKKPKKENPP